MIKFDKEENNIVGFEYENDLRVFYEQWVDQDQERVEVYGDFADFKKKVNSLKSRFVHNAEKEKFGVDIKQGMVLEEMENFDLSNKIWGVKGDDDKKRINGGDFIRATSKDLTILFLMFRNNQGSTEGLFEKWPNFDVENTDSTETQLLDRISHLHQSG
ncbi:hypothetical protein OROGR_026185 [Orobanche gracilis]